MKLPLLSIFLLVAPLFAAQPYPPKFDDARAETYKSIGETKLSLHIFEPAAGPKTNRPAVVFFFGGSWKHGSPTQFEQHCRHLAARGVVAIAADYRVAERHEVKPVSCVADAKSAIRYVRAHAARLGVDPRRIAAAGGSAGGHLAAATATLTDFDEPTEDRKISSVPDALVLFNPPLVLADLAGLELAGFGPRVPEERMGTAPKNLSPAHHVRAGAPPTIIFHGKADTTVPYATAAAFARVMQAAGNRCELVGYEGETHGFFNYGRGDGANFKNTLARTDAFLVSLGWMAAANATIAAAAPTAAPPRPNILFIVSEDNGPELGCYGNPRVRTPNLDRLATDGVRFNRAYVTQAGCSQSRSSIMTGLYPHQNGQLGLATWGFRMYRADTPNIARSLKAAGYRTGIVGKLHINPESAFPFDFSAIPSGNFARKGLADYAKNAEKFMQAGDEPFFLSVNYPDAHQPWTRQVDGLPKQPLTGKDVTPFAYMGVDEPQLREQVADYYNCMSRLDTLVGDLLAALERSGQARNTLVVYLGDHGADMLRGKRTSYEGGVRIPLLVRWPAGAKSGQVREELVSTIDLLPTALATAGAPPLPNLPGRSLAPLLRGDQTEWRSHLFTEFHTHAAKSNFYPQRTVRDDRYKLIENLLPGKVNPGYAFTVDGHLEGDLRGAIAAAPSPVRAAYARMERPARWELFDLQSDPFEFNDLSADAGHAAVLARLQAELAQWRRQTADPLLKPENLKKLADEIAGASKQEARELSWQYPYYFFGDTPPPAGAGEATGKKKRKNK